MGRISRQRLIVGLSTLLDAIAVGLFFVQTAVGDKDWIKEEFTSYEFYSSVSDLGILVVIKAFVLILVYSVIGVTTLIPVTAMAALMNAAGLAKVIAFIVFAVRSKTKLPGLHFALPVFVITISWIQVFICRYARNLDHLHLIEFAENETYLAGDYASIQTNDYRVKQDGKTAPISQSRPRRYVHRETEPLLPGSASLSKSFSIAVVPSVPLVAPALKNYALAAGLDGDASTGSSKLSDNQNTLPPASQLATLMRKSLPTKTYIRALKQISNAFTLRDVVAWIKQAFPNPKPSATTELASKDFLLALLQMGLIASATQPDAVSSDVDIDSSLFVFTSGILEEEEPEEED